MIRIWAKVMAENVLLSSPRWADKQMPDPGLALRQEAKIRPATAPGDLLLSRRILGAKKWSQEAYTLNQAGCLFPFPPMQSSFCDKFTLCLFSTIKYQKNSIHIDMQSKLFLCAIFEDQLLEAALSQHLCQPVPGRVAIVSSSPGRVATPIVGGLRLPD